MSKPPYNIAKNIIVENRRTSVRLEPEYWDALNRIVAREGCKLCDITRLIFLKKPKKQSVASALRVYCMLYYKASSTDAGHIKAGHGSIIKKMRFQLLNKTGGNRVK